MKANSHSLVLSRLFSGLSFQIIGFYCMFQSYLETESSAFMGLVGLLFYLPTILFSYFSGKFIDKTKSLGLVYLLIQCLQILPILVLAFEPFGPYYSLLSAAFMASTVRAMRSPTYYSLLGLICKSGKTVKLNTLSWQLPLVVGPLVVSFFSNDTSFSVSSLVVATFLQVLSIGLSTRYSTYTFKTSHRKKPASAAPMSRIFELGILKNKDAMRPMVVDAIFAGLLGLGVFMPFFLKDQGIDPLNFGYYKSLFFGCSFLGVAILPSKSLRQVGAKAFRYVVVFWALGLGFLMFSQNSATIFLSIAFLGLVDGASSLIREEILFSLSGSPEFGRFVSLNNILISTGDEFGEFGVGGLLSVLGVKGTLLFNIFVSFLLVYFFFRNGLKSFIESLNNNLRPQEKVSKSN